MKIRTQKFFVLSTAALLLIAVFPFGLSAKGIDSEFPLYEIRATLNTEEKSLAASQKVTLTNTESRPIEDLVFHIYPNRKYTPQEKEFINRYAGYFKVDFFPEGFDSGDLEIQSVYQDGKMLSYRISGSDETILKVDLPDKLAPGQKTTVSIDFTVKIPHAYGRFGWHENILRLSRWYPILSVHDENGWKEYPFYPFHRPFFSEASHYSVQLTVPLNQKVIHTGFLKGDRELEKNQKLLVLETAYPVRDFSLAMSPDYQLIEEKWQGITIKSFYLPGDEFFAKQALDDAKGLMEYYTKRFGPYDYSVFSIAPVHLGYGGEQMSNMIFIDTRAYKLPKFLSRYFDFLISHETGHQWFYNMVGIDEYTQMWLEEGVHSHFILEYLEEKYGAKAQVIDYPRWMKDFQWLFPDLTFRQTRITRYMTLARTGFDHPVVGELSSFQEPSSIFSLTYGKGSRIVGMLREVMGKEAFDRAFSRVFREFHFKNLDIRDLVRICQQESGKDLTAFFEQWLYTDKSLDFAVSKVQGTAVEMENRGEIVMPVEVKADFANGESQTVVWDARKKKEPISFSSVSKIRKVSVDPDQKLMDIDRTNNRWPRKVNVQPVPLYLGLYDIPVFLPDDSFNFVFGPEIGDDGLGAKASFQKPYDYNIYAATDYELGEDLHHTRVGYQLNNISGSQTTFGAEVKNTTDLDGGEEDLLSAKTYVRRELWPASYGLTDLNDHVTFYLIRNRELNGTLLFSGAEDDRNFSYLKRNESIIGSSLHFGRYGPYPDPKQGYQADLLMETSQHFWNATQYFYRASLDFSQYYPVTAQTKFAYRLKYGWGYPDDKNLYQLGGIDGLRGFDRKTVRGSNAFLGSAEYRFPLLKNLNWHLFDHILGFESIGGVVFFDSGKSWYDEFSHSKFKKDAGVGLRFTVNAGSFLEKAVLRLDFATPIDEDDDDTKVWFGINHAF